MGKPTKSSEEEKPPIIDSEETVSPSSLISIPEVTRSLAERVRSLPELPGVYIMRDGSGEVIYIGKAKNLRLRVKSYFGGGDGRYTVQYLVPRITEIETVVTADERQALILENDLIKNYKPYYNIRLKDDKAHLLVRIDLNHPWPRIELVRKRRDDNAKYIGPFAFGYELKTILEVIRTTLPLRTCSDRVIMNRVRPCLEYQLKRCSGPCCIPVSKTEYMGWVNEAIDLLEGKNRNILELLNEAMQKASDSLRFEDAAKIRDQIQVINEASIEKTTLSPGSKDAIGLHRDGDKVELSVLQVRQGRLMNAKTYGFEHIDLSEDELLTSFLSRYYEKEEISGEIILPFSIEDREVRETLYSERQGSRVRILVPEKGEKYKLLLLAQENAKENFLARFAGGDSDSSLNSLKEELGLTQVPRVIECADISHFQGGSTVASVVNFTDSKHCKTRYRHFHLDSQEGKPDDFSSMLEVVTRHLSRCAEENQLPDLLVIDGGKAQLAKAIEARCSLGLVEPVLIGLAKKRTNRLPYFASGKRPSYKPERIYVEGKEFPIVLRENSKALHLLEGIRDEAHRFAITFHRSTRTKVAFESILEKVPGLGPERRKLLLKTFGSVQRIKEATPEDIHKQTGLNIALSRRITEQLVDL